MVFSLSDSTLAPSSGIFLLASKTIWSGLPAQTSHAGFAYHNSLPAVGLRQLIPLVSPTRDSNPPPTTSFHMSERDRAQGASRPAAPPSPLLESSTSGARRHGRWDGSKGAKQ